MKDARRRALLAVLSVVIVGLLAMPTASAGLVLIQLPPWPQGFTGGGVIKRDGTASAYVDYNLTRETGWQHSNVYADAGAPSGGAAAEATTGFTGKCFTLPAGTYTFYVDELVTGRAKTSWSSGWFGRGWAFGHLSIRARLFSCYGGPVTQMTINTFYQPALPMGTPQVWNKNMIQTRFTVSLPAGSYYFESRLYSYHLASVVGWASAESWADVNVVLQDFFVTKP